MMNNKESISMAIWIDWPIELAAEQFRTMVTEGWTFRKDIAPRILAKEDHDGCLGVRFFLSRDKQDE